MVISSPTESQIADASFADRCQAALLAGIAAGTMTPVYGELRHTITAGINGTHLYTRECTMPPGSRIVSMIHRTCHPYVVSRGIVAVKDQEGLEIIQAPHQGITLPGTQRVLLVQEETVWTTFHIIPDTITDPDEAIAWLTIPINNPLLEP